MLFPFSSKNCVLLINCDFTLSEMGQFLSRLPFNPSFEDLSDEDIQEHILSFIVSNDIIKEDIEDFSVPRRTRKRRKRSKWFTY